jgi:transposase
MARRFHVEWQEEEQTLFRLYKHETDHQHRTRLQALWLLRGGEGLADVAKTVGVHYRTLQSWVGWYRQGGLEEVLSRRHGGHGGPACSLSQEQQAELASKACAGEVFSIQDGVAWAKQEHGIDYSYWGMRHVFERLGLKRKVPRPKSPKASDEAQRDWKKGA